MNSYWLLYFIEQVDNFIDVLSILLLSIAFIVTLVIFVLTNDTKEKETAKKFLKKLIPIVTILILSLILIPSTKSCYGIIELGTIIEYSKTSEKIKELPDNLIKAVNNYLERNQNE